MEPTLKYLIGGLVGVALIVGAVYKMYMTESFTLMDGRACTKQYPGVSQYIDRPYPFYPKNTYFKPLNAGTSEEPVDFEGPGDGNQLYTQYR